MSETDSFIEEVTEEVRRDKLFAMLRKYGWIGVVGILGIVGGATYSEYNKAQTRAKAQAAGDAMFAALELDDAAERAQALREISLQTNGSEALRSMLVADQFVQSEDLSNAASALQEFDNAEDTPEIYRDLVSFKALLLTQDAKEKRSGFDAINQAGNKFRVLAQEQLAILDLQENDSAAAIERLQSILNDSESSTSLKERAFQFLTALGEKPDLSQLVPSQLTQDDN